MEFDGRGVSTLFLTLQSTVIHLHLWKQAAENWLKWGKAQGICGIHAELLMADGNAVLVALHAVLCSAWNTGIIPTDWKRGLVGLSGKGRVIARTQQLPRGDVALTARQSLCSVNY